MAYHSFSLIPAVGNNILADRFAHMDRLFSRLTGEKPLSDTPAYNFFQRDPEHYELTISVPGYNEDELDVSVLDNQLTISAKQETEQTENTDEDDGVRWLHRGISKNAFSLSFRLEHRISIQSTNLDNGLLTLHFSYEIPEEKKPQKIAIGFNNGLENKVIER